MGRNYIERRIIAKGIELCEARIESKGTPITADDLLNIEIRTFAPLTLILYTVTGIAFTVFGIWVHIETRSMVQSILPVLVGVGHVAYALYGRPRKVKSMSDEIDLMDLTAEIVSRFVRKQEARIKREG